MYFKYLNAPLSPALPNRSYLHAIFIFSSSFVFVFFSRCLSSDTPGNSLTQCSPTPTICSVCPWQMPSAAKYRSNVPEKSVVPLSSTSKLEPSGSPACPPNSPSSDGAPVEMVGCEVNGDGRTPEAVISGFDSAVSGELTRFRPTAVLRFRKAIWGEVVS